MATNWRKDPILSFSDIDMDLTKDPLTEDVTSITGEEVVKQSLKNLLQFKRYEKPFHPEIESGITDLLFEPVSPIIMIQMKRKITELIQTYERRVRAVQVDIFDLMDENSYRIDVQFQVQNKVDVFRATVIVERIR
jgi:phage baseplate assembly protein W